MRVLIVEDGLVKAVGIVRLRPRMALTCADVLRR